MMNKINKIYKANNFSLFTARVSVPPEHTSLRDYHLILETPLIEKWLPGQFVMLRWGEHQIGRPFAIVDWFERKGRFFLEVWIRKLGAATNELFDKAYPGYPIKVTAPLGAPLDPSVFAPSSRVLFVSGGVGAASLLPIWNARKNLETGSQFWIHGERSVEDLDTSLNVDVLCLENGVSKEVLENKTIIHGRVTEALVKIDSFTPTHILVCGPTPMLEAVAKKLLSINHLKNAPCYLAFEEKMGCGIGLCFSCSVKCVQGMQRCCTEGPWFLYRDAHPHFEFRGERPHAR